MRVAISGMFWSQPNVGSGQYVHGLVRNLTKVAPQHQYILLLPASPSTTIMALPSGVEVRYVRSPFDNRSKNLAKVWYEQIGVPLIARRSRATILHVPYAAPPLLASMPVITTVHDIIWRVLPEYRGQRAARVYFQLVPFAVRGSAHILADSEHSRRDIIMRLDCPAERVTTVLLAADEQYHPIDKSQAATRVMERYGLCQPFIYYVGGLDARKNVATLIHAFAQLRRAGGPEATLVIAGRALGDNPVLFPAIDQLIADLGLHDAVRRIDVPREDGPLLYAAATVFAFPSRYEGFGLGPLEAMACGTPAVVAAASSLPEVVGDAALTVAPDDIPGWTTALWRLLADTRLRENLRQRGLMRVPQFSYDRVARQTLAVYQKVANVKRGFLDARD